MCLRERGWLRGLDRDGVKKKDGMTLPPWADLIRCTRCPKGPYDSSLNSTSKFNVVSFEASTSATATGPGELRSSNFDPTSGANEAIN